MHENVLITYDSGMFSDFTFKMKTILELPRNKPCYLCGPDIEKRRQFNFHSSLQLLKAHPTLHNYKLPAVRPLRSCCSVRTIPCRTSSLERQSAQLATFEPSPHRAGTISSHAFRPPRGTAPTDRPAADILCTAISPLCSAAVPPPRVMPVILNRYLQMTVI